jgi:hypothetical protein
LQQTMDGHTGKTHLVPRIRGTLLQNWRGDLTGWLCRYLLL